MLKLPNKIKLAIVGMIYGMMLSFPAVADDIEIYTTAGTATAATQANVLFVLDTSGSMGTTVNTRAPYDPNVNYGGGLGCYNSGRTYTLPYGSTNAWRHCHSFWKFFYGSESGLSKVNNSAIVCDDADSLNTSGFYTGRVSQYRSGQWRSSISSSSGNYNKFVECEVDHGVHGQTTGNSAVWAQNGGPWSNTSAGSVNWGGTGLSTTLYSGNYLNYVINAPIVTSNSRIGIMQDVIEDLIDSTTGVNIGLMRFSQSGEGGMMATPVDDITTNATTLKNDLNAMTASGGTPLSESFYEAALYFQGRSVDYGNSSSPFNSVSSSKTGGAYKSPITNECQKNYVILLTDGAPSGDSLNSTRRSKLGISSCSGNCLDEIAKSIATNDQSASLSGDQVISTFTIGFDISNQLLIDTAKESFDETQVGEFFLADDAASLADTLNSIFANIYETDTSFSSPAVSVNAFNRSTHLEDLYFTLFKPAIGPHWPGNLKKYKLDFFVDTGDVDGDGNTTERLPFIADVNGFDAVDTTSGFFDSAARSFWSDSVDGTDVSAGGAANEFDNNAPRNVYTFTDTYTNNSGVFTPSASGGNLTSSANALEKSNANITDVMLDIVALPPKIGTTPRIETLLDWASGLDVFDNYGTSGSTSDQRLEMGDPLHSQPALVQYGGTPTAPDLVAYVATNDGYLHAYDADDGSEIFSFVPQELLQNLNTLMDDAAGNKMYGLDGDVVAWINDINKDGIISGSDHVYLYITMRRGGNNIYSLDVTDRNNPKLRWVIKGGTGDYAELGQTWSSINVEKVKDGSSDKDVLVFGGGYDTNQDGVTTRSVDSIGRAVYIADAKTGGLLWSAGASGNLVLSDMKYSVPARVKPLDLSGDGYTDRLYVADMGGQIFRFDINNNNGSALASSITGGRIADLADGGINHARRFYYPPDVALIAEKGQASYLALAITSGYRAHPNDKDIHDRIYLLKDEDVYNIPSSYVTLEETDLYDATLNLVAGDGNTTQNQNAKSALDNSKGWYIKLDDENNPNTWIGEKGLSEALILDGVVIATTFTPVNTTTATNSCEPQSGTGKVFFLDVLDASPAYPANTDKRPERHKVLDKGGIPPSPNVIITKGGEPTICIGTECDPADFAKGIRKTNWYEVN